jgi:hypothetical protein
MSFFEFSFFNFVVRQQQRSHPQHISDSFPPVRSERLLKGHLCV